MVFAKEYFKRIYKIISYSFGTMLAYLMLVILGICALLVLFPLVILYEAWQFTQTQVMRLRMKWVARTKE